MKREIYIALGTLFVIVGAIGVVVPLLPTTPFLLLALYFYLKSSFKFAKWLLQHKLLGPYVRAYYSKEKIPRRVILNTLLLLWGTILFSLFFVAERWPLRFFLLLVAVGVTIHILQIARER